MRFIAVIDIGKTNAKVAIVDSRDWREAVIRTIPNTVLRDGPYPHFDVETIWQFIVKSMAALNAEFPIDAISITTHGACCVLLDENGGLAMPVLDYEYDGPQEVAAQYDLVRPDFAETGSPRLKNGLNLGAQIFWQMASFPEYAKNVAQILTYPQYWGHRLTGIARSEVSSLGCHTDLWNPRTQEFSSLVSSQGWQGLMANVCKADETLGFITDAFAEQTGLAKTIAVKCGIHDSNASLYPHLLSHRAPFSVVSSGTWTISMAVGADTIMPDQTRDTLVNVNAFGEPVPSARFMGGREFDTLMAGRKTDYAAEDRAAVIDKASMILPSAANDFGPFQGREMKWLGHTAANDGEHYVAVSFYLALVTATCLDLIGAKGITIVEGPFAKNNLYLQMLSAATQRDVVISNASASGTSIGAAMLVYNGKITRADSDQGAHKLFQASDYKELNTYAALWFERVLSNKR